jgi:hypothetical protein
MHWISKIDKTQVRLDTRYEFWDGLVPMAEALDRRVIVGLKYLYQLGRCVVDGTMKL